MIGLTRRAFVRSAGAGLAGSVIGLEGLGCAGVPSSRLSLFACKYAESTLPEDKVFRGGSKIKKIPISFLFYMLEIDGKRMLVDAGCDWMGKSFKMEHFIRPVDLLRSCGIKAGDISDVIVTHSHHDHIGGVVHFRNATVHIQENEAVSGAKYLEGLRVETFGERKTVARCIEIQKIGGHCRGSSIVHIGVDDRKIVLAGDECYIRDCLVKKISTGASFDPEKSEAFVRMYSNAEYEVHLYHDPSTLPGRNGILRIV